MWAFICFTSQIARLVTVGGKLGRKQLNSLSVDDYNTREHMGDIVKYSSQSKSIYIYRQTRRQTHRWEDIYILRDR